MPPPFANPPPAFAFSVLFNGDSRDSSFQEVSGLKAEWSTQDVAEGGQNRYVHRLPVRTKYSNLMLKRGVVLLGSPLALWLNDSFAGGTMAGRVQPRELIILLLNRNLAPVLRWWVSGAYPISWDHSAMNSMESNLLIESVELSYAFFERDEIA